MSSTERTQLNLNSVLSLGRPIFALAIIALGVETMVCARYVTHSLGPQYEVIPALPWLPAIPGLAYAFGLIWVVCGAGLFSQRSLRPAAMALGGLLFVCTLILDVPKNAANIGSIGLRWRVSHGCYPALALRPFGSHAQVAISSRCLLLLSGWTTSSHLALLRTSFPVGSRSMCSGSHSLELHSLPPLSASPSTSCFAGALPALD